MTNFGYIFKIPIGDGATRDISFADSSNNIVVDELRVNSLTDITAKIHPASPAFTGQNRGGITSGYVLGGKAWPSNSIPSPQYGSDFYTHEPGLNTIQKFNFASTSNATDIGDLTENKATLSATQNATHAYACGGYDGPVFAPLGNVGLSNKIEKFPFASEGNAIDAADLTENKGGSAGAGSGTHGYVLGGNVIGYYQNPDNSPVTTPPNYGTDRVEKFPFSSDANASDVADLADARHLGAGISSDVAGYIVGGILDRPGYPFAAGNGFTRDTMIKVPFASDNASAAFNQFSPKRRQNVGYSSVDKGFSLGGAETFTNESIPNSDVLITFPFASDTSHTTPYIDFTSLPYHNRENTIAGSACSSLTQGFFSGGHRGPYNSNRILSWPFATNDAITDVADLLGYYSSAAGTQI